MYKTHKNLKTLPGIVLIIIIFLVTGTLAVTNSEIYAAVKGIFETSQKNAGIKVVRIVDGDTIIVNIDGEEETVRMIGIDTPESVKRNSPVECFGKEASDKTKELLSGKTIILENDPTQSDQDRYGRILRYVYLENININKQLIAEGYAYEYTYEKPYKYQQEFKTAQKNAQDNKLGLWNENSCNGKR